MPNSVYADNNKDNAYADDNIIDNAFQDSKSYIDKTISDTTQFLKSFSEMKEYACLHAPSQIGGFSKKEVEKKAISSKMQFSSREMIEKGSKELMKRGSKELMKEVGKKASKEGIKAFAKQSTKAAITTTTTVTGTVTGNFVGAAIGKKVGDAVGEKMDSASDFKQGISSTLQNSADLAKQQYIKDEQTNLFNKDNKRLLKIAKQVIKFFMEPLKIINRLMPMLSIPLLGLFLFIIFIVIMGAYIMIWTVLSSGAMPERPIYNVSGDQVIVAMQLKQVLEDYGLNEYAIAGALGNMQKETSLNPATIEKGGGCGLGLIQISKTHPSIYYTFKDLFFAGLKDDTTNQMIWILEHYDCPDGSGSLIDSIRNAQNSFTSVEDATDWWYGHVEFGDGRTCQQYEGYVYTGYGRPITLHEAIRYVYANNWYNYMYNPNYLSGTGNQMVANAQQFLGNHYVYGGTDPTCNDWNCKDNRGVDCSGFTQYLHRQVGINIPRTAQAQADSSLGVDVDYSNPQNLQAGDLIFYGDSPRNITHVAMYMGGGQIIHASSKASGIKISDRYNYRTIQKVKRFY